MKEIVVESDQVDALIHDGEIVVEDADGKHVRIRIESGS